MIRQSPHTITYQDLVDIAEEVFAQRESWYKGAKGMGAQNLDYHVKKMNVAKVLLKMLKKGLPGKQMDMLELFKSENK